MEINEIFKCESIISFDYCGTNLIHSEIKRQNEFDVLETSQRASLRKMKALHAGANQELIDAINRCGNLQGAIMKDDARAIRAMVEHGVADINVRAPDKYTPYPGDGWMGQKTKGKTALEKAVEWNDASLVSLLLSKGADPLSFRVDEKTKMEGPWSVEMFSATSAAYEAIKSGRLEILRLFLKFGMSPNATCHNSGGSRIVYGNCPRDTFPTESVPLHVAAARAKPGVPWGQNEFYMLLVEYGLKL